MEADRSLGLLGEALELCRATGERFCEAEILRLTGDVLREMGHEPEAEATYETAAYVARRQGARMLELRVLTSWARLAGSPSQVASMLASCAEEVARGGPCRSLAEAKEVLGKP
jgi:hypothetical protein